MKITVNKSISVEGIITANGKVGGASGGSIWINTYEIEGSGIIRVSCHVSYSSWEVVSVDPSGSVNVKFRNYEY